MIKMKILEDGIVVSVKVQPNASKDRVVGEHAEQLKIAVTVAPEKGKANKAVIKVLSKSLGVKSSDIEILSGETSRDKKVLIRNITKEGFSKLAT
ncbi:MAG: YggU family protein [Candidatus Brocadiaceae bacterium]|nr:YggU family protein [Candidatus Brocadiaceae bacterium]